MHHAMSATDGVSMGVSGWFTGLLVALVLAALVCLLWLLGRDRERRGRDAKKACEDADCQVLAMLHQAGGTMSQTAIREALDLPVDVVGSVLAELERDAKIERTWVGSEYTFGVRVRD